MMRWRTMALAVLGAAVAATSGVAQNKDKKAAPVDKCGITTDKPDEVKSAASALAIVQLPGMKPDQVTKNLKTAMNDLTLRPEKYKDNQIGHDFVLGQALAIWSLQPNQAPVAKKGDLGYLSDKEQSVDLLAAADTAFRAVETANPECAAQTAVYRQQPWAKLVSPVGAMLNNNQLDSANALLTRAEVIYRDSPYAAYYKGQLAQRKNDMAGASDAYASAAKLAHEQLVRDSAAGATAKDSNLVNVEEYSLFAAGYTAQKGSEKLTGQAQKDAVAKAGGYYKSYLATFPNGPNAPTARNNLTMALKVSGDTAALGQQWTAMLANPTQYSALQLYDAGTAAFTANQIDVASKLMDAARDQNPWLRSGLFNAANVYWKAKQWDKMLPVTQRLTQIDPNNPDNYQLQAIAYQAIARDSASPKPAAARKAYNDSATKIYEKGEALPVKATLNIVNDGSKRTVQGTLENRGVAAKQATMKVDFLDKQGNVVASQTQAVSLPPKKATEVTVSADGASIVGFRYSPIS